MRGVVALALAAGAATVLGARHKVSPAVLTKHQPPPAPASTEGEGQTYWWYYQGYDAENEDISQLPCKASCTIAELETACAADAACVAFNTCVRPGALLQAPHRPALTPPRPPPLHASPRHGFLKRSIADMAPDSCDLYVKKTTPQPSPTPAPPPPAIPFWPLPVHLSTGATTLPVSKSLAFTITGGANPDLAAYAARTAALMFQHSAPAPAGAALTAVTITVANPAAPLVLGVDESYNLTIPSDGSPATLLAATNYGAYWGLQTLAQAVRFDFDARAYAVPATPIVIGDAPKFAWRGILIDTDRHWLSLPTIFAIIDSLTYAKMNVVHWHIVDWQSWPLESVAVPNLWNRSWSPRERYTLADIATVVEYARARGVRTVPEFDVRFLLLCVRRARKVSGPPFTYPPPLSHAQTPGHASSMCYQYPELCPSAACGYASNHPLTPVPDAQGRPVALNAIQGVLTEIAAQSPDEFFHLGGDEVAQDCWQSTPAVQAWMAAQGINSTDGVYEYFVSKVDAMAIALGKSPIRWEEVWKHFGTDLDKRTVIHAWLSSGALIDATSKGYRAIWSVDGLYYLDALDEVWQSFYSALAAPALPLACPPLSSPARPSRSL